MKKTEIPAFWGDLYQQLYAENHATLTPEILEQQIVPDSVIERWLGKFRGFGWMIKATKPEGDQ